MALDTLKNKKNRNLPPKMDCWVIRYHIFHISCAHYFVNLPPGVFRFCHFSPSRLIATNNQGIVQTETYCSQETRNNVKLGMSFCNWNNETSLCWSVTATMKCFLQYRGLVWMPRRSASTSAVAWMIWLIAQKKWAASLTFIWDLKIKM